MFRRDSWFQNHLFFLVFLPPKKHILSTRYLNQKFLVPAQETTGLKFFWDEFPMSAVEVLTPLVVILHAGMTLHLPSSEWPFLFAPTWPDYLQPLLDWLSAFNIPLEELGFPPCLPQIASYLCYVKFTCWACLCKSYNLEQIRSTQQNLTTHSFKMLHFLEHLFGLQNCNLSQSCYSFG